MSDRSDLEELARRYLDLWQDQVTALANDAETAEAMERLLAMLGVGARPTSEAPSGWPAGPGAGMPYPPAAGTVAHGPAAQPFPWTWPAAMMAALQAQNRAPAGTGTGAQGNDDGQTAAHANAGETDRAAARSASAAGASDGGAVDLDELLRRIAALEDRIAALEGEPPRSRGKAAKGHRKRRS